MCSIPLLLKNENDPTILSGWRRVVPVEEFFDIISEVHCKEKGHVGSKKTNTEVRLPKGSKFDSLSRIATCNFM